MRWLPGIVGAAILAVAFAGCAALSGLDGYSAGQCSSGCDAGADRTVPADSGRDAAGDGTLDTGVTPAPDADDGANATDGTIDADDASDGSSGDETDAADADDGSSDGGCGGGQTECDGGCVDTTSSANNCGGCGPSYACPIGQGCRGSVCTTETLDAGADARDGAGVDAQADATPDGGVDASDSGADAGPCGATGCPVSTVSTYSCRVGGCNAQGGVCSASAQGCYCTSDGQCLSGKCVNVGGQNDVSCGASCTGSGAADGFDCKLTSPGIPLVTSTATCPTGSGYNGTTLTCDSTHTNCYCNADSQCPSGKCIPNAANNASCSPGGPCTGIGTPDYRGCVPPNVPSTNVCFTSATCLVGACSAFAGGSCMCTNDNQCESGKCVKTNKPLANVGQCGSSCTGSGTADAQSCQVPPTSVACTAAACTTSLSPAPVPNPSRTACVCVADADCSSGKCVNVNSLCSGTCTGSGPADSANCVTVTSAATAWSCSSGNCDDVTSPSGTCMAAGVPCWCSNDTQCSTGPCIPWSGCATGACTGSGTPNAFHCAP